MARAQATIEVFAHFCAASGIEPDDVARRRDARDPRRDELRGLPRARPGGQRPARARARGEEEARYGYLAAVNSTTLADGVMLDIGGGSMQLVHVVGRHSRELDSWRLGAVRMTERFLPGDGPAKPKQLRELRGYVDGQARARAVAGPLRRRGSSASAARSATWPPPPSATSRCPRSGVQGFVIAREELDALVERARRAARRPSAAKFPGIKPSRGDIILAGAIVVQTVMEVGGFDGDRGHRGRPARGRLLRAPPRRRPAAVRRRAPRERRSTSPRSTAMRPERNPHVAHVAQLALGLFDELAAAGLHDGDAVERELLWAARAAARHRHDGRLRRPPQALALPRPQRRPARLRAARGRAHRPGRALPPQGHARRSARSRRWRARATTSAWTACRALLRLAEDLERWRDQLVRAAHVAVDDGTVRLDARVRRRRPRRRAGPPGARSSCSRARSTVSLTV